MYTQIVLKIDFGRGDSLFCRMIPVKIDSFEILSEILRTRGYLRGAKVHVHFCTDTPSVTPVANHTGIVDISFASIRGDISKYSSVTIRGSISDFTVTL